MGTAEFGVSPQSRTLIAFVRRAKKAVIAGIVVSMALILSSCTLLETPTNPTPPSELDQSIEIAALEELVTATRTDLETLRQEQSGGLTELKRDIARVRRGVNSLPQQIDEACTQPVTVSTTNCDDDSVQTIVVSDNKMVVGELEHIWVEPPGISLTGRIDTGTTSNLLRVDALGSFERDGEDWVRFNLRLPGKETDEPLTIEREVSRYSRTRTRRPVVKLRLRLGDVLDSYEFILVDRSDNDHAVLLGRNFLKDVALVDVGRQFVQPQHRPKKSTSRKANQ